MKSCEVVESLNPSGSGFISSQNRCLGFLHDGRPHCFALSVARCFWTRSFVVIFPPMIPTGLITDSVQDTPAREVGVRSPRVGGAHTMDGERTWTHRSVLNGILTGSGRVWQ